MSRRVVIVSVLAAVVLAAVWFLLLWGPQSGELEDAQSRTTAAETDNEALELRLARLQAAQEKAPELIADLDDLRRAVPDGPELAEFILDANEAASDTGVDFLSISPGVPQRSNPALPPVITL